MEKGVWVQIRNFKKLLGRSDIQNRTWFCCANDLLEDEDFFDFEFSEICVWLYILGQCSKKKTEKIFLNYERAERFARLKKKEILSAIEKLKRNQLLPVIRTDGVQISDGSCTDGVRNPCSTEEDRGGQDTDVGRADLPKHASAWNSITNQLPKVREWGEDRQKLAKKIPIETWEDACRKVEASEFLSGRSGKWTGANIDWMLKPKNLRKVLEGNYDSKSPQAPQTIGGMLEV